MLSDETRRYRRDSHQYVSTKIHRTCKEIGRKTLN